MMGKGEINKDNYLTDCANAVVYVRESADKIERLESELSTAMAELASMRTAASKAMADYETANHALANCKAVAEIQSERVRKLEAELAKMTARAETAEDSLVYRLDINQQLGDERNALAEENEWHLASEPPKEGYWLTTNTDGTIHEDDWNGTEWRSYGRTLLPVTHYRKLPQPPKGQP